MTAPHRFSLIVPIYNGGHSLERALPELLACARESRAELVLVNDGSSDDTAEILNRQAPGAVVVHLPANRGKGHAVAQGMLQATAPYRLFTDADLDYPLQQLEGFVRTLEAGADVVVGCRALPSSRFEITPRTIPYVHARHRLSRLFNWMVRHTILPGIHDTQAGIKGFTAAAAETLFTDLTCHTWAFDLEVLYRARRRGLAVVELPIIFRYHEDPSNVKVMRHGVRLLTDLTRLTLASWRDSGRGSTG